MCNLKDWQDALLENQEITSNAKLIGLTLSRFFGKNKRIFPSQQTIAYLTSNTINTVRKSIEILIEYKFIEVQKERLIHQGGFKNHYKLTLNGQHISKNYISTDILIDMLNDMSPDMLIYISKQLSKNDTEYILSNLNISEDIEVSKNPKETNIDKEKDKVKEIEDRAILIWNEFACPPLPKIKSFTKERRKKFMQKFNTELDKDWDNWRIFCVKCTESDFLIGKNSSGWKADIDWALQSTKNNILKTLEGGYENGQQ